MRRRVVWTVGSASLLGGALAAFYFGWFGTPRRAPRHHSHGMAVARVPAPNDVPPSSPASAARRAPGPPRQVPARDTQGVDSAHRVAVQFRDTKGNAFFQPDVYLQALIAQDGDIVPNLSRYLSSAAGLNDLATEAPFTDTRPAVLLDRMAAIDLLEAFAENENAGASDAQDALADLVARPLDGQLNDAAKRVVVGEKLDALTALTRVSTGRAFALYAALQSPRLAALLEPAIVGGLIDTGVSREQASDIAAQLRAGLNQD